MDLDDDACQITVTNHDVQIKELLFFVSCKSNIFSNSQNSKCCCDFYAISTIQEAKDVLLGSISLSETDKRKWKRKARVAETCMEDIISIFYEVKPRVMPTFVSQNPNNLPLLLLNNFDMAHIIEEMSEIKYKMTILQEAREKFITVHAFAMTLESMHSLLPIRIRLVIYQLILKLEHPFRRMLDHNWKMLVLNRKQQTQHSNPRLLCLIVLVMLLNTA